MKICVFGAASDHIAREYLEAGRQLGLLMAQRGDVLVFGGGSTGMMGSVVRGVQEGGGRSIGVAPSFFDPEVLHETCDEFIYTDTMRQRKGIMEDLADAFIITPGGIGTMEEFFEVITLKQLKQLHKPICIYNISHCYDPLKELLENFARDGFMDHDVLDLYFIADDARTILNYIDTHVKQENPA